MVVTTIRQTRQGRRHRASGGGGSRRVTVLLRRVFREGFSEKVRCEQRPERGEGISCEVSRGKGIRRKDSKYRDPEARGCLCGENKEAGVAESV